MVKEIKNEIAKDIEENDTGVRNYRYMPMDDADAPKDIKGPIAPAEESIQSIRDDRSKIQASPPLNPKIVVDDKAAQES